MNNNDAILSADSRYRYVLSRFVAGFNAPPGICLWVMVNPSTADATTDDHTIRKLIGYCKRWGFSRLRVVNLWAFRSKEINMLSFLECQDAMAARLVDVKTFPPTDIVGPDNDRHIHEQVGFASEVIVAWGSRDKMPPSAAKRIPHVLALIRGSLHQHHVLRHGPGVPMASPIFCIGRTKSGDPRHPLTTPYNAPRVRFED